MRFGRCFDEFSPTLRLSAAVVVSVPVIKVLPTTGLHKGHTTTCPYPSHIHECSCYLALGFNHLCTLSTVAPHTSNESRQD